MYCNRNQFQALPFFVTHPKLRGARGLSKHYNLGFGPKLSNGACAILRIPFACAACKSILGETWISGIPSDEQ